MVIIVEIIFSIWKELIYVKFIEIISNMHSIAMFAMFICAVFHTERLWRSTAPSILRAVSSAISYLRAELTQLPFSCFAFYIEFSLTCACVLSQNFRIVSGVIPTLKVRGSTHSVVVICSQFKVSCEAGLQLNIVRRLQLKCDGTLWRTGGEVKGKLANGVGSQYPSHYLGTWCIQH